jgi:hypothetical protein
MPLPVIAGTMRCSVSWGAASIVQNPDRAVNVFHVEATSGNEQAVADALSASLDAMIHVMVCLPTTYAIQEITCIALNGSSAGVPCIPAAPAVGTGSGEYISQGCLVMSWHTAGRGAAARGRNYFGPITESAQSSGLGIWDSADVAADGAGFISDMSSAGFPLVVASYVHSVKRTVTSARNDGVLRTQRKRNHGR